MSPLRVSLGLAAAAIGGVLAGPAGAYAGWKLGGFAATLNPIYLLPGGSTATDGLSLLTNASDLADASNLSDVGPPDLLNGGNERRPW